MVQIGGAFSLMAYLCDIKAPASIAGAFYFLGTQRQKNTHELKYQFENYERRDVLLFNRLFLGVLLVLLASATLANPLPSSRKGRESDRLQSRSKPCPEYGPGFVRIAGRNTCVKVGGKVEFELSTRPGRNKFQSR